MTKRIAHLALIVGLSLTFHVSASAKPKRHQNDINAFHRRVGQNSTRTHQRLADLRRVKTSKDHTPAAAHTPSQTRPVHLSTLRLLASFLLRPRDKAELHIALTVNAQNSKSRLYARESSQGIDALIESRAKRLRPVTW